MKSVNELIEMGFNLSVKDDNIKIEHKGSDPPDIAKAKPLIEELKDHKKDAIEYLKTLVVFKIQEPNFDNKVQVVLNDEFSKGICWQRLIVYSKSKRLVLVGVIKKPEHVAMWH